MLLTISYLVLLAFLLWLLANRKLVRETVSLRRERLALMQEMIDISIEHQRVFREMISRVHHKGIVPISASALGLMYVISLEISKCTISLQKLQDAQDWRTHSVILELSRILMEEGLLLELKLKELNDEVKRVVNEYDRHQYNGHPDNNIEP